MLKEIFKFVSENNCSDLHLNSENFPMVRINGELKPIESMPKLEAVKLERFIENILSEEQYQKFQNNHEIDFPLNLEGGFRYRGNAFRNLYGPAVALRAISKESRTLAEIGDPGILKDLAAKRSGLVIISGPTGCGKSTTLAAMVRHVNENDAANIITIEDPIEYVHESQKSLISQREVGTHCNSFAGALRAALREDPDIILVGEMRDLETISLALTAAETGHLVLATLHTSCAANAVSRIIDVFDPSEQPAIRSMLANSLNAVVLQHLLPNVEGSMSAAFEVMVANTSICNMIRENKLAQINSMMEMGSKYGMVTFKDSVAALVDDGIISQGVAEEFLHKFQ